jgi:hypothetical protein
MIIVVLLARQPGKMKHILCLGGRAEEKAEKNVINRPVTTMNHLLHLRSRCFAFVTPVQNREDVVWGKQAKG